MKQGGAQKGGRIAREGAVDERGKKPLHIAGWLSKQAVSAGSQGVSGAWKGPSLARERNCASHLQPHIKAAMRGVRNRYWVI